MMVTASRYQDKLVRRVKDGTCSQADRIREQEMVAFDWIRKYKVQPVQEVDDGDFLAVFRFMEE